MKHTKTLENREESHMRLRNIPRAGSVLDACKEVVKNETECRGRWRELFGNPRPIHIEIGMGKGQFLLTLAAKNPDINYIGIERYSSVLLRAVERFQSEGGNAKIPAQGTLPDDHAPADRPGVSNIRFICMDARNVPDVFAPGEIDRIYLNFSDPWPKSRHASRRLTSKEFLARYHKILSDGGTIEFKTDNRALFDFSVTEVLESPFFVMDRHTFDLHRDTVMNQGNIMTEYEEKFSSLGNPICKLIATTHKTAFSCIYSIEEIMS